ncbi:ParB/RepB/Spo0J family partition protein [Citricoccus muralis]|uniref:ParB/RepB/Spo0J family partition protein n=1 Tax=Citricoccus muralis TaxID=169134 RepID=A0ABY8HA16_9MICC|nr:ParB/RepB/Spo0J family partition protein [Citricoccus muralis]WFP17989.1 ParB/RepB/Spo0J family partition protein [Citricoccus muralis]
MSQKKSRRGLGRGLSALIQDTSANLDEQSDDTGSPVNTESSDDEKSGLKVEAPSSPTSVAERYLANEGIDEPSTPVSRETRRPVDIFFPEAPTPARRKTTQERGPVRREMPNPLSTATSRRNRDVELPVNSAEPEQPGPELRSLPIDTIVPNPRQPRDVFNEEDMDELIASIREVGVLQPIVVRPTNSDHYELVMGERRWRASRAAGLMEIPVIIRHTADEDLLRDALLENIHRSELNPLEEAAAYEQLLRDFNCTQDELSERIGRSRPQISNTLRLMKLPPLVQRRVASGVLSAGHARALLGLQDEATMERVAQRVMNEGLSVRATEELVALTVNGTGIRRRATRVTPAQNERFEYLANTLTDELDTTVKISLGAKKGRIAIDFASVEDLNRIMDIIQPSKRASDS